jgi:hypothetical protein
VEVNMAAKYERVQMLLEPEQRRSLEEIARRKSLSVAEATRQAIELGLAVLESEDLYPRWKAWFTQARKDREMMPMLNVDLVEDLRQMREERDDRLTDRSD